MIMMFLFVSVCRPHAQSYFPYVACVNVLNQLTVGRGLEGGWPLYLFAVGVDLFRNHGLEISELGSLALRCQKLKSRHRCSYILP